MYKKQHIKAVKTRVEAPQQNRSRKGKRAAEARQNAEGLIRRYRGVHHNAALDARPQAGTAQVSSTGAPKTCAAQDIIF